MKNPFEKFGIDHLSPSSCNAFSAAPALWVMERLLKRESPTSLPALAGRAAEQGVTAGIMQFDRPIKECQDIALAKFTKESKFNNDDEKKRSYNSAIPRMVERAIIELRDLSAGPPTAMQGKITYRAEGLLVPFEGYFDYIWENKGWIFDLKTSLAMPSEIKVQHARQVSLYKHATSDNYQAFITTVTPSRVATREVQNTREHLDALVKVGISIQKFLSISDDPYELAALLAPDYDSFYWNNPTARGHSYQVWGY